MLSHVEFEPEEVCVCLQTHVHILLLNSVFYFPYNCHQPQNLGVCGFALWPWRLYNTVIPKREGYG